jgi:hypothetical protein
MARGLEFSTEIEKVFNPETMTLATQEDVDRMWRRLWGNLSPKDIYENWEIFGEELVDRIEVVKYVDRIMSLKKKG